MGFSDRIPIIKKLEKLRQSTVVCYLTSVRPNLNAAMSEDAVRVFFDHLQLLPRRRIKKLDIFLCSNGGSGTVPWRLISLFREYAESVGVLIPYRAYSAASLLALGADEIIMHPFGEMGPIDPTVVNAFNPVDPNTRQQLGISVEDVKAYISFIKTTVGIHHEDELVKVIEILAQKIHPLALGNVERFISQSRLIARKILETRNAKESAHNIDEIIETMASKLYFHGHPINRKEARTELKLAVPETVDRTLEDEIWNLYLDFETEMKNRVIYDPMSEIFTRAKNWAAAATKSAMAAAAAAAAASAPADPVAAAPAAAGAPAAAAAPVAGPPALIPPVLQPGIDYETDLLFAIIESAKLSSQYKIKKRLVVTGVGQAGEPLIRDETLAQSWEHSQAP